MENSPDSNTLHLSAGSQVIYQNEEHTIKLALGLDTFLIERLSDSYQQHAKASELSPINAPDEDALVFSTEEAATASAQDWEKAKVRESIIKPLALLLESPKFCVRYPQ